MRASLFFTVAGLAAARNWDIKVGDGDNEFDPDTIKPAVGDTVSFHLFPNHDVVAGSYDSPCQPTNDGFYSGPYSGTDNGNKRFVVNVTSTSPVYYYSSVGRDCQSGMVGGWNLPDDTGDHDSDGDGDPSDSDDDGDLDDYEDKAKNASSSSAPPQLRGGVLVGDETPSNTTSSPSTTAPSATHSHNVSTPAPSAPVFSGLADTVSTGPAAGVLAVVFGVAAYFL